VNGEEMGNGVYHVLTTFSYFKNLIKLKFASKPKAAGSCTRCFANIQYR
jgi:hypothetical protein